MLAMLLVLVIKGKEMSHNNNKIKFKQTCCEHTIR